MFLRIVQAAAFLVLFAVSLPAEAQLPPDTPLTLAPLVQQVTPAVVNISTRTVQEIQNPLLQDPFFRRFFNLPENLPPEKRETVAAGSGVIVDAQNGYVLTNNHVVAGAQRIRVTTKDGRTFEAKLVGRDPPTDIAVLKIDASGLQSLPFGDSGKVQVGDYVLAIGNPFGLGQTVTNGIVSAVGRSGLGIEGYEDFIQTDASINPGNSGGALVDFKGKLIGINTAILAPGGGNVGIGFAVPINMARAVMKQLIAYGEVKRGRIGVAIQDLTPDLAAVLAAPGTRGAAIVQVEPGSPAAKAGLERGDVVVGIDDTPIRNAAELRNRIGLTPVGTRVALMVERKGEKRAFDVIIEPAKKGVKENAPRQEGR
ncbi:MAG: Do family serine endopeptidase [Magnetospirillum sp.]|nr:Do family serine endopeptidase [Magnetospirillum sp.]